MIDWCVYMFAGSVLPQLLTHCRHADANVRHGSILSAAHITHALTSHAAQSDRSDARCTTVN